MATRPRPNIPASAQGDCRIEPQGYPAQILASSAVVLASATGPARDFSDLAARWANGIEVLLSRSTLDRPTLTVYLSVIARRTDGTGPYLVFEGTLDECIREFMAKPESTRHLYEILTAPQPPLVTETLSAEHVAELARLREFL